MNKEAYNYSIFLLSKRDYSSFKLKQKLKSRKYQEEEISEVLQKLIHQNYLREQQYTNMRIKTLLIKGFSNSYIIQKLGQEEIIINNENVELIKSENNINEDENIDYLIQKKLRNKKIPNDYVSKQKLKSKVINFLMSKGHSYSKIQNQLEQYFKS